MKSKDIKQVLNLALRLTAIVAAVVLMLAAVNAFTSERIKANTAETLNAVCGELIEGGSFEAVDMSAVNVDYSGIKNVYTDSVEIYRGTVDGDIAGYCVTVIGKGYSSDGISLVVGISADGQTLYGVKVLKSSETSGIGSKVLEDKALGKFAGRNSSDADRYNGISGATRTSRGIKDAVRAAVRAVNVYIIKGGAK